MSAPNRPPRPNQLFLMRFSRWLLLALAVVTFSVTLVGIALFPAYATAHPEVLAPTIAWTPEATLAALADLGWSAAAFSLFLVVSFLFTLIAGGTMALVMLLRKSDEWFGLFAAFVFILLAQGGDMFLPLFSLVPGIEQWFQFTSAYNWQFMFIFLLLFPDGQFVPRWTRWTILGWLAVTLGLMLLSSAGPLFIGLTLILVVIAVGSQPYRYFRHAGAIQRQQTKWVVVALMILLTIFPLALLNVFLAPAAGSSGTALIRSAGIRSAFLITAALIPLSMGLAILRYRLWDIDVIIRKTLVFGALTGLLALVYFGSVIILSTLFGSFAGENSPLGLVISTLLIAALFRPMRRRIQNLIDRRFFRAKYDAQRTLAAFAQTARVETDLEALTNELAKVVEETMRPESVTFWLRRDRSPATHPMKRKR